MGRARGTTIAAVASPTGGAPRGVVRLSGPRAADVVAACCSVAAAPLRLGARGAYDVEFDDGVAPLPARVLWFPGPRSLTREDVVELHVPGAAQLVRRALARVLALGATLAEPGEFTRRAFLHGRIDLSRAEGVLALVEARTRGERRAATALLLGGLEGRLDALRDQLDGARALVEASLDFDESDTGHVPTAELRAGLAAAGAALQEALGFEARREVQRGEAQVALVGEPNAGKSSLFNALTARDSASPVALEGPALVADLRGTTRDAKRGAFARSGRRFTLIDTAGLELAEGAGRRATAPRSDAEAGAEARTLGVRAGADLLVWVLDARHPERATERHAERALGEARAPLVVAWNQIDRPGVGPPPSALHDLARAHGGDVVATSAVTGAGVDDLAEAIAAALGGRGEGAATVADLAARTRERLAAAARELALGAEALDADLPLDLVAQHLRDATAALDAITGRTTPEDLLDRIFARFCLGK